MAAIFFLAGYSTVKNRNGESKEGQTKAQSLQPYLEQNKQLYTACWPEREVEWRGTYVMTPLTDGNLGSYCTTMATTK